MDKETQIAVVDLPLALNQTKGKVKWLTLNNYRNWHYKTSNGLKIKFKKEITPLLKFKIKGKVKIEYFYYAPNKRKRDLMNVISVIDKFFQDAMVERGCIEADDLSIVVEVNSNVKSLLSNVKFPVGSEIKLKLLLLAKIGTLNAFFVI